MADPAPDASANALYQYVHALFSKWKSNRETKLEKKWWRNLGAYNRDPSLSSKWKKADGSESWTSEAMSDVTKQKVVAAHAIVTDVYFKGGRLPVMLQDDTLPEEVTTAAADELIPDIPPKPERDTAIASHEQLIHRQHAAFDAKGELDRAIKQAAIYGETFVQRYVYLKEEKGFIEVSPGVIDVATKEMRIPAFKALSVWSVYRDLDVDDPMLGHGVMIVDRCSPRDIIDLKNEPFYDEKAISAVVNKASEKVPDQESAEPRRRDLHHHHKSLRRFQYQGLVPRRLAAEVIRKMDKYEGDKDIYDPVENDESDTIECHLVAVGGEIIKFVATEREDRNIDRLVWEDPVDDVGGIGVCDNLVDIQHTMNGLHRNLDDNAKIATSLILALRRNMVQGDVGDFTKRVNIVSLDVECKSATDAVQQIKIDGVLEELKGLIQFHLELADLSSFIPRIQQGQQVDNSRTAFELSERIERSGKYLGVVVMHIDSLVERLTTWAYQYNMMDDSVPASKKGVWRVKALGFSSFQNRVVRLQKLLQLLGIILQSETVMGLAKVRYLLEEICKAMDLDPAEVLKSPQELLDEARQQQDALNDAQASGAVDPVMAQKIQAEINEKTAAAELKIAQAAKMRSDVTVREAEAVAKLRSGGNSVAAVA